jgi:ankyrin repeat protein
MKPRRFLSKQVGVISILTRLSLLHFQVMCSGMKINGAQHSFTGKMAIRAGAKCGPMIDLLMPYGADINAPPSGAGRTALQHAAAIPGGNLPRMRKLIAYGADVEQCPAPFWGRTAVQEASHYGSFDAVVALVDEYNADVNGQTAMGSGPLTALEACALRGSIFNTGHSSIPTLAFLLRRGARLTPNVLHFAAAKGEEDTVKLLLAYGAQIYDAPTPFEHEPIPRGNNHPLGKDALETAQTNRQDRQASARIARTYNKRNSLVVTFYYL